MKTPATSHEHAIEITRHVIISSPPPRFTGSGAMPRICCEFPMRASPSRQRPHPLALDCAHAGRRIEWDADITSDTPDREIAWEASAEAELPSFGSVRFEPLGPSETTATLALTFHPRTGVLGSLVGNVAQQRIAHELDHALDRAKSQLEKPIHDETDHSGEPAAP